MSEPTPNLVAAEAAGVAHDVQAQQEGEQPDQHQADQQPTAPEMTEYQVRKALEDALDKIATSLGKSNLGDLEYSLPVASPDSFMFDVQREKDAIQNAAKSYTLVAEATDLSMEENDVNARATHITKGERVVIWMRDDAKKLVSIIIGRPSLDHLQLTIDQAGNIDCADIRSREVSPGNRLTYNPQVDYFIGQLNATVGNIAAEQERKNRPTWKKAVDTFKSVFNGMK